jgi:hypothetical protein
MIDRYSLLLGVLLCVVPLVFVVWWSGVFQSQSPRDADLLAADEQAAVDRPHNIFDDMPPQGQALETTEQDCRMLHGIYDGARCVMPYLAR